MMTWKPTKWFAFKTWGIAQVESVGNVSGMAQAWIVFYPLKDFSIEAGYRSTLPTEQRPLPPTANSQFETWSECQIVGAAPNIKLKYSGQIYDAGLGLAYRNGGLEYSAMVGIKFLKISGWYNQPTKQGGLALTLDTKDVYNTLVLKQDVLANIIIIHLPHGWELYSDNGVDMKINKLVRCETGILKTFESKLIRGLCGVGYNHVDKSINVYFFPHF